MIGLLIVAGCVLAIAGVLSLTTSEPFGHVPTCRWIETRQPDPDRCDKCRWIAEHQTERGPQS